jgi:hypothetical protein
MNAVKIGQVRIGQVRIGSDELIWVRLNLYQLFDIFHALYDIGVCTVCVFMVKIT